MGFSIDPAMVRVDRFKVSGKWYDTHQVNMSNHYDAINLPEAVLLAWMVSTKMSLSKEFFLVCLEPYNRHSHPVAVMYRD
jgi:hypothetical protein